MFEKTNQEILLVNRPSGMPVTEDFRFVQTSIPELRENEVLVKTLILSVDPYMRGRMNDTKSYVAPYELNEVISGGGVAQVIDSRSNSFKRGDIVTGNVKWSLYSKVDEQSIRTIDPTIAPISTHVGILGMPGLTAYFGLLHIGKPQKGETVVVSGAAGAVGSVVGQIAKIKGAHVVGIAGSEEKLDYLRNELGFDAVVNYKKEHFSAELEKALTKGVDVYYDNVGGVVSDEVMKHLNTYSRIPVCGAISAYNLAEEDIGPRVQSNLIKNSTLMQGFTVGNYAPYFKEAATDLSKWLHEGKLTYEETVVDGFENTIEAFLGLFKGTNLGKQIVRVAEPEQINE